MSAKLDVRPYGNKVLVIQVDKEKSQSDLIVFGSTMSNDGRFVKGVIVAVGDPIPNLAGILLEPKVNVGDIIVYNKLNALEISHKNKKYMVVPYHEIQAVIEEDSSKYILGDEEIIPRGSHIQTMQ